MTTTQKGLIALGAVALAVGSLSLLRIINQPAKPPSEAAPPGWDFCTMPSYYTRACETSPMSQRWGGTPGTCPVIAICGNHAAPCIGEDGLIYPIISGVGANDSFTMYKRPNATAGPAALAKWDDCYINHHGEPACELVTSPPTGTLTYTVLTWSQLPPGPQKTAWGIKYGCFGATPTNVPSATPSATPTPVCPPTKCPTCPPAFTPTRTKTPCFGSAGGCPTPVPTRASFVRQAIEGMS